MTEGARGRANFLRTRKPVKNTTHRALDDPTRIAKMLAVRDPRVDERPVDG